MPTTPLILQINEYAPPPQSFVRRRFLVAEYPRPQTALHDSPSSKRLLVVDEAIKLLIRLKGGVLIASLPTTCRSQMKLFRTCLSPILLGPNHRNQRDSRRILLQYVFLLLYIELITYSF
jgi:hypothetical protein